jgi:diacylglycerol kinase family enzyme
LADVIDAIGQLGCIVTLRETAGPGDAGKFAAGITCADADVLVVAGGDGTINEAINGRRSDAPPLAILPMGTANLLALELGLPTRPDALARMVVSGPVEPACPARLGTRLFLLMAGAGFDANVVARLPSGLKRVFGAIAYVLVSLRLLAGGFGHPAYEVEIDGVPSRAASVIVAKGHYYAGRHVCARAASIDMPELQVCLFERAGSWQVICYALGLVRGRLEGMAGYRVVPARRVVIRGPAGEPIQLDGDVAGRLPATIDLAPETLPLVRWTGPANLPISGLPRGMPR